MSAVTDATGTELLRRLSAAWKANVEAVSAYNERLRKALEYCEEMFRSYSLNVVNCDELGDESLRIIRAAIKEQSHD